MPRTRLAACLAGAVIIALAATAFGIFFLRQFFRTLPIEYEESARVDGASRLIVLRKIVLPLSAPPLATLARDVPGLLEQFPVASGTSSGRWPPPGWPAAERDRGPTWDGRAKGRRRG